MPERRYCTMEYLRGVLNGRKKVFKNEEVRKVRVPRYKELTVDKVMTHCVEKSEILSYLPDLPENGEPHVDRDFLFTIVNTVDIGYFPI